MRKLPLFPTGLPPSALDQAGPLRRNPSCARCPLGGGAIKRCLAPAGEAGGLLVVGAAPDRVADATGSVFQDQIGRYVAANIGKVWKGPATYTYAVNCYVSSSTGAEPKHADKCRPYLKSYLGQARPTRVLLLGELPIYATFGQSVSARSVRRGFGWVRLEDGTRIPAVLLMDPWKLDGRYARAAWEADLRWATSTPDSFFSDRLGFLEAGTYFEVDTDEEAREAAEVLRASALELREVCGRMEPRGLVHDVESRGKMHNADFRVVSWALGASGTNTTYVFTRRACQSEGGKAALRSLTDDPRLTFVEQGSYDESAAKLELGRWIAGGRRDVRLLRKSLDCAVPNADLDTMSFMVGMGGYKSEFAAELAAVKARTLKWDARQSLMFDDCPDHEARLALHRIYKSTDDKAVADGEDSYRYALVPPEKLALYNARDMVATGLLDELVWPQVQADPGLALLWQEVTGPASRSYTVAEHWGAPMSRAAIEAVVSDSKRTKARLEPQMRAHLTRTFANCDFASVEQVARFLFTPTDLGGLGLTPPKQTTGGANSVDEEALDELAGKHPFVDLFRAYVAEDTDRKKAEEFQRFTRDDGRTHPSYLLDGTRTGRPSCRAPNLFNMKSPEECEACAGKGCAACENTGTTADSRRIRACFEAPEGFEILEVDESQVELRGMAVLACEPVLIGAYVNHADLHQGTVEYVFQIAGVEINRRLAKVANFMIPYGGTAATFASRLKLPLEQGKIIYGSIEGRYPMVNATKRRTLVEARQTGSTYNLWFRDGKLIPCQRRPLWDLDSTDGWKKRKAENGVFNSQIQGTFSGSLVLASHARLVEYVLRMNLEHLWRPAVCIYDSIIGPVHKALRPLAARITVDIMTDWVVARLDDGKPFPLEADCKVGRSLALAKKYKPPATYKLALEESRDLGLDKLLNKRSELRASVERL